MVSVSKNSSSILLKSGLVLGLGLSLGGVNNYSHSHLGLGVQDSQAAEVDGAKIVVGLTQVQVPVNVPKIGGGFTTPDEYAQNLGFKDVNDYVLYGDVKYRVNTSDDKLMANYTKVDNSVLNIKAYAPDGTILKYEVVDDGGFDVKTPGVYILTLKTAYNGLVTEGKVDIEVINNHITLPTMNTDGTQTDGSWTITRETTTSTTGISSIKTTYDAKCYSGVRTSFAGNSGSGGSGYSGSSGSAGYGGGTTTSTTTTPTTSVTPTTEQPTTEAVTTEAPSSASPTSISLSGLDTSTIQNLTSPTTNVTDGRYTSQKSWSSVSSSSGGGSSASLNYIETSAAPPVCQDTLTYVALVVEEPTIEVPTTEEPTTETPTTETPTTEEVTTEEVTTEEPTTEEPTVEDNTIEDSSVDLPSKTGETPNDDVKSSEDKGSDKKPVDDITLEKNKDTESNVDKLKGIGKTVDNNKGIGDSISKVDKKDDSTISNVVKSVLPDTGEEKKSLASLALGLGLGGLVMMLFGRKK